MNFESRKPEREGGDDALIERGIGAEFRVHTELGFGFVESLYEEDGLLFNVAAPRLAIKGAGREFQSRLIEDDISF